METITVNKKNIIKGQVLIIILMIMGTLTSIFLSLSFKSNIETQLTKLEEENQKAFAAAQAGIEEILKRKQGSITIGGATGDILQGSDVQGSARIENLASNSFISPPLQKDEQYTFYLANYNELTNAFSTYWSGNLTICFNNTALEITQIKSDNTINRIAINPSSSIIINNAPQASSGNTNCPNNNFLNYYNLPSINNTKLLIIRLIGSQTSRIGIKGSSNFPSQGSIIVSQVKTTAGATKVIQFFQSYPQIPTDFFVTSF